ncbi:MAG: nuclear transport factor 2 family protein [Pedobacter sp.]
MKLIFTLTLVCISLIINAQSDPDSRIKRLEQLEAAAMLKGDTLSLSKLWSPDYVVNNPLNVVVDVKTIKWLIRNGKIDYTSFDRIIDKITYTGNLAIVMGTEVVKPERNTENSGKTVNRRYTNVWINTKGTWLLVARQATNIEVK